MEDMNGQMKDLLRYGTIIVDKSYEEESIRIRIIESGGFIWFTECYYTQVIEIRLLK